MAASDLTVPELFASLCGVFATLEPPLLPFFNAPCEAERIGAAERRLGLAFPADLRELLLCADGQDFPAQEAHPIFPVYRFAAGDWSRTTSSTWFIGLDQMVEMTGFHKDEYLDMKDEPFETVGPASYHYRDLAFTATENSDSLVVDLQPAAGGTVGQVVMVRTQPCQVAVLAPSLGAFLAELLAGYSSGRFRADTGGAFPVWTEE